MFRFNRITISKPATTSINSTDKETERGGRSGDCGLFIDGKRFSQDPCNCSSTVAAEINLSSFNSGQTDTSTAARAASWPLTIAQVSQLSLPGRRRSHTHQRATLPSLSLPHCGCTPLAAAERERERERESERGEGESRRAKRGCPCDFSLARSLGRKRSRYARRRLSG